MVFSLSMVNILLIRFLIFLYTRQSINQLKPKPFLTLKWLSSRKGEARKTTLSSEELRKKPAKINLENWVLGLCSFIEFLKDMMVIIHVKKKKGRKIKTDFITSQSQCG